MKIISIDVGIKNCSFCVLTSSNDTSPLIINNWDIINLTNSIDSSPSSSSSFDQIKRQCSCINKNRKKCTKTAIFKRGDSETEWLCKSHALKDTYILANDLKPTHLKKQSLKNLQILMEKYGIKVEDTNKNKKADLLNLLVSHHLEHGLFLINEKKKEKKCATIGLQIIGKNILSYFDKLNLCDLDHVIIENQIGPLATKMKTVQGMLMQYFIMRNENALVEFVNATNKLKEFNNISIEELDDVEIYEKKKKQEYADRKKMAVSVCSDFLTRTNSSWIGYFDSCKKKDDLADCFLQGMWYINK